MMSGDVKLSTRRAVPSIVGSQKIICEVLYDLGRANSSPKFSSRSIVVPGARNETEFAVTLNLKSWTRFAKRNFAVEVG